ncbi:hypothetical protein EKO04_004151 [Ascochyta lentis]|uniref:Uncharacterized protein n=1 Tax=Ascochyta lentis TaxID=205686 RepID=A0A8H7J5V5_9PLEO|nr:hypothetical protein EKO04_004151 [Ascochyta lentis]
MPLKSSKSSSPSMEDIIFDIENILEYQFEDLQLCRGALRSGKEQDRLTSLHPIPIPGNNKKFATAARECGLDKVFTQRKRSELPDEKLAKIVKALLGAVAEDSGEETDVCRAAHNLGLWNPTQIPTAEPIVGDLLGLEELKYVVRDLEVLSVPVLGSLI